MMNLPINRRSLADEVASQIKTYIRSGQLVAGQQLPTEPELMKQYGVGRSTIREAVRMLANSGLLRVQQGVGTFINEYVEDSESLHQRLQRAAAKDIDEVRQLLEVKIAQNAAIHRTQQQLDEIEGFLNERIETAHQGKIEECIQADINFHVSIAKASGNDILADMYEAFSSRLKSWFLQVHPDTSSFIQTNDLHKSLFLSIRDGSEENALKYARQILRH
jgi:DNA-binding FadR family transcriptional regulator